MHEQDPRRLHTDQPGADHIVRLPKPHKFSTYDPGKARDKRDPKRQHHFIRSASPQADHHQRKQYAGKCRRRIIDTHQDLVQPAAEISGHSSEDHPADPADQGRPDSDQKRASRAAHNTAQHVPPELIRPEPMRKRRSLKFQRSLHHLRIIRRPENSEQDHERHRDSQNQTDPVIIPF